MYNSDTSSSYCIVCPTPKVKSSFVTIYLVPFTLYYLPTPLPSGNHHTVFCVYEVLFSLGFVAFSFISHIWMKSYGSFSVWFILITMIVSRPIHVVISDCVSSYDIAEEYSIVYIYYIFFIQSPIKAHFRCFHVLATMNNAMNIRVHISLWKNVFKYLM